MKCKHGCGQESTYKDRCDEAWSKCPALKIKMSEGMRKAHKRGVFINSHSKEACEKQAESLKIFHKRRIENTAFEKLNKYTQKQVVIEEQKGKCNKCKLKTWNKEPIPLALHHKDGNKKNKARENEEALCFNCHAQTDNFGFKGRTHDGWCKNSKSL